MDDFIDKQFQALVAENEKKEEENLSKFLNENPKVEDILSNASFALQNNEELRNIFLENEKQLGTNILPTKHKILPKAKDLKENENDQEIKNALMKLNLIQGSNVTASDECNESKLTGILGDPLKALETNEKLRNAVAAKGKQMGWDLFPTNNELFCDATSTDLGLIKLNEKIRTHQPVDATDTINILMFGKSGCGQTTLLSYLTGNKHLIGTDSMSTQQFSAETFQLPSDTGMTNIRINESPGMCSGLEVKELQEHWNHLISRVNNEGGVSVFLLLIKANVRIELQFIDEIEEFSELYFKEKEELWKRTVVVFTTIDELKGCDSYEDRVNKLETQIAKPGMEKVKKLIDQTSTKCIYFSCKNRKEKGRLVSDLKDRIHSIYPTLLHHIIQHSSNKQLRETSVVERHDDKKVPGKCEGHRIYENYQDSQSSNLEPISTKRIDTQHDVTSKPEHIVHKPASKKNVKSPPSKGNNHLISDGTKHHPCSNIQEKQNSNLQPIPTKLRDTHSDVIPKPEHLVHKQTSEICMSLQPSKLSDNLISDGAKITERKRLHSDSFCSQIERVDPQKLLQSKTKDQIISLCVEICKDKHCENVFTETYHNKFYDSSTRQVKAPKNEINPSVKKKKKKRRKHQ